MEIKILQIHKRDSYHYKFIQDKYGINTNNKTFAMADGTTQSFRSEEWAKLLADYFVENPTFIIEELIKNFSKLSKIFESLEFEFSLNPAKASLERAKQAKGGTSTFLGIQFLSPNKIRVISCGDGNLFIVDNNKSLIASYPFADLNALDDNNYFLNTKSFQEKEVLPEFFQYTELEINEGESILLATDALSRFILKENSIVNEICEISDFKDMHQFCLKHSESKELEEDDITAIIISPSNNNRITKILPPSDFEFPRIETPEFIPTVLKQTSPQIITPMQMNEINNQFNGVAQDFHQVKRSLRLNRVLMGFIILLLSMNLAFLFYSKGKIKNSLSKTKTEKIVESIKDNNAEVKNPSNSKKPKTTTKQ